eukprot:TRINITY_DN33719_c0_g1_i1.p1 TRINITY_DN33719_c0_g1~~TRINITY_DN33719_c0_g1_i1.p1  ORF type:complete len:638 (+),score=267.37 TRINITY_DN33719_c0_g1_i1:85-1998(+)
MDALFSRASVSPNPPFFDFDCVRQTSTTPPPAPGPYNPLPGGLGYGGVNSPKTFERHPPPPPIPHDTEAPSERERYELLQAELKEKFIKVQHEYADLEANLKADYAAHEAKLNNLLEEQKRESQDLLLQKEKEWYQKDEELRQLHKMMALQQQLMEEQLESIKAKERELHAKEAEMKARLEEQRYSPRRVRLDQEATLLHEKVAQIEALEQRLIDKEKTFKDREITIARLEKQNVGFKRMQRAVQSTIGTSTDVATADRHAQCTATTCDASTCTEEEDGWVNDVSKITLREREAEDRYSHAEAMWTSAKRREAMLKDWEEKLQEKETIVMQKECEYGHIEQTHERVLGMTEILVKAAAAAESKLVDELDERLTRRLHAREKQVLMRTQVTQQSIKEDQAALELWEKELEGVRTMLHEKAQQIKQVLGVSTAEVVFTSEEDLKAREAAMREKETRWAAFLRREIEHRSLEAQRFDLGERVKEVSRRERELDGRQMKLNEEKVRVSTREVEAKRIEDEAARVIQRLDTVHGLRTKAETEMREVKEKEALNEIKSQQIEKEYAKMRQRWDLLREKEKRFELRLQLERQQVPTPAPSPAGTLHMSTPLPQTPAPRASNLENAVYSITNMLDSLARSSSAAS